VRILNEQCPIHSRIKEKFGPLVDKAIFAWGDTIYNPAGASISHPLLLHELVHADQQRNHPQGVEGWWELYLQSDKFRLEQEIPAHRMEYKTFCEMKKEGRNERRLYLKSIVSRLSGPLYGNLMTFEKAKQVIKAKDD
jgi:hypothetical protein